MKPLENIKVVELGTHVAAPVASRIMAEWGADVIKVETTKGESYRTVGRAWKVPTTEDNSPILQTHNGCKRSLSLNLKDPDGKEGLLGAQHGAQLCRFLLRSRERSAGMGKRLSAQDHP